MTSDNERIIKLTKEERIELELLKICKVPFCSEEDYKNYIKQEFERRMKLDE